MSLFKDLIQHDLGNVFMNADEFAEPHIIQSRTLTIIVDHERLMERTNKEYQGSYIGDILFFVSEANYGPKPKIGEVLIFDKKPCTVTDAQTEDGMHEIILQYNGS